MSHHLATAEIAFRRFAAAMSRAVGSSRSFGLHLVVLIVWFATGPHYDWSAGWWLGVNTWMSVEALLICLLVLNVGVRDGAILQAKADELLRAIDKASERLVGAQDRPEEPVE